jgi:four helix bundle protein
MNTFKDLNVYKQSLDLVTKIYSVTSNYPSTEIYGLTNQIRRAAVSIPSNIAEGSSRAHPKETIQFLYVSLASANEIDTQLEISQRLNFISSQLHLEFQVRIDEICKMIQGMIKYHKTKLIKQN